MITIKCDTCGKNFQVKPYLKDRIKFCSKECRYKSIYPEPGFKRCYRCMEIKPLTDFHILRGSSSGHQMKCKECALIEQQEWRQKNKAKVNTRCQADRRKRPVYFWAKSVIDRHRAEGYAVEFTATELRDYIEKNNINTCEICGKQIIWGQNKGTSLHNSPSVDRRENGNILNFKNIQFLCRDCNTTKGARTMSEFIEYCKLVARKFK